MTNVLLAVVLFAWRANTEPDLAGYNLYHGSTSGIYSNVIELGLVTNCSVQVAGKSFFRLTARNSNGLESDPTPEVVYNPTPTVRLVAERSVDAVIWEPAHTNIVPVVYPLEFFRLRVER